MTVAFLSKMLNPELKVIIHNNGDWLTSFKAKNAEDSEYGRYEIKDFNMSAMTPACVIEIHY